MKLKYLFIPALLIVSASGCAPVSKIARHDFISGYYSLKKPGSEASQVYVKSANDSITIFPVKILQQKKTPDTTRTYSNSIVKIKSGDKLYKSCFIRNSVDIDLTTIVLKYRFPEKDVPNQLSSNINAALYVGIRKDFYLIRPYSSPLKDEISYIMQIGFDAGLFAGIGITPINSTVTHEATTKEYDGMIFQKGIAGFVTFDNISVGLALGFDNLLDKNRSSWIYNQRPYLGLVIGISNF